MANGRGSCVSWLDAPRLAKVSLGILIASSIRNVAILDLVDDTELPGSIAYVAPASWHIPDLGIGGSAAQDDRAGLAELLHPTTHGNPLRFDEDRFTILLAVASMGGRRRHRATSSR